MGSGYALTIHPDQPRPGESRDEVGEISVEAQLPRALLCCAVSCALLCSGPSLLCPALAPTDTCWRARAKNDGQGHARRLMFRVRACRRPSFLPRSGSSRGGRAAGRARRLLAGSSGA